MTVPSQPLHDDLSRTPSDDRMAKTPGLESSRGWLVTSAIVAVLLGSGILVMESQAAAWLLSRALDLFDDLTMTVTVVGGVISFGFWLLGRWRNWREGRSRGWSA